MHSTSCTYIGDIYPQCSCPECTVGTVHSLVGSSHAVFRELDKYGDWEELSGQGNPVSSAMVRQYVKAVHREQSIGHTQVKQAIPVFPDKLQVIAYYIDTNLSVNPLPPRNRFYF